MSFVINFMYNHDPLNKINKSPISRLSLEGELRNATSICDPTIRIEYDGAFTEVNYAYIAAFKRYYYVTDIVSVATKLWDISMHCDVLKTYTEGILGSSAVIAKQETEWNMYLDDGTFKANSDSIVVTKVFPNGFKNKSFILALAGDSADYSS